MGNAKVRISLNLDEEHYNKLKILQNTYTKDYGIKFDMTKTIIKTLNDYYNLNIKDEEIIEK